MAVLVGHFFYVTRGVSVSSKSGPWATYTFEQPKESRWVRYVGPGQYWVGFSYGLAGAFVVFCLGRAIRMRRESLAASAGGLALGGLLWASFCFFAGCCGSPMLPIYLGLLGPKFTNITKPLTFVVTFLSILIGYALMQKRAHKETAKGVNRLHENIGANPGEVRPGDANSDTRSD
ncbi:MAG: hypothetical protein GXP25_23215 [Planctomycetes bacterium]|nr:hypothetical protein [Planctomycetota bacterium]